MPFRVIGRNHALHVFAEEHWYRVTVEDVCRFCLTPWRTGSSVALLDRPYLSPRLGMLTLS